MFSFTGRPLWVFALMLALPFAGSGCESPAATVTGDVVLDGTPIESGTITFESPDQKGPTMSGAIVGGRYEVKGTPGKKKVLVTGFRPTGKKVPAGPPLPPDVMVDEIVPFPRPGQHHIPTDVELSGGLNAHSFKFNSLGAGVSQPAGAAR
jgi:hypothetical protein